MSQTFLQKYGDVELRYLGWKQPFASLMLHGKIETRVWDSKYRGWVLITASKAPYDDAGILAIAGDKQYGRIHSICPKEPLGQAIAIGRLVYSRPMLKSDEDACFVQYKDPWVVNTIANNKYGVQTCIIPKTKRLWCHIYEDVQAIEPIDWHGSQGWKTVGADVKERIVLL